MGKTDINNLGQYFTPDNIAEYMANEVISSISSMGCVLDPCIGENIFFSYLDDTSYLLKGVEIDESLITNKTRRFFDKQNRNLTVGDFIDHEFDEQFDAVIMNPPYTRQEKVSPATKRKLQVILNVENIALSAKANLYVYFLLKGISLLKDDGILVAITYDSWLYSSFGVSFKKYLVENHNLKKIIHFKHDAFEGVDVGATLLIIHKKGKTTTTEYVEYESADNFKLSSITHESHLLTPEEIIDFNDHTILRHPIVFPDSHFTALERLSDKLPWRGASSPSNKYFLFKSAIEGLTPVLKKTPRDAYVLTVKDVVYAFVQSSKIDKPEIKEQLAYIKTQTLQTASNSLKDKISKDPYWYKFPVKPGGDIIFNYYFRDNPRFILNLNNIPTMGNYYNVSCPNRVYETFALLNSSLTRYALFRNAKSQGRGLRKIQLYKFNQIPVLQLEVFNSDELASLKKLGKHLSQSKDVLKEIDSLVLRRYCNLLNVDYNDIKVFIDMEINK